MGKLTVQIFGSREWDAELQQPILDVLKLLPPYARVVHGAARGADRIAGKLAKQLGLGVKPYPADWDQHGKAAGPIRNAQILAEEEVDFAYGYRVRGVEMPGSDDMASKLGKARIPYVDIYDDDPWLAEAAIARGVAYLDEHEPAWFQKVVVDRIDFRVWQCPVSQLAGGQQWGVFGQDWFYKHDMGGPIDGAKKRIEYGFSPALGLIEYRCDGVRPPQPTKKLLDAQARLTQGWKLATLKKRAESAVAERVVEELVS